MNLIFLMSERNKFPLEPMFMSPKSSKKTEFPYEYKKFFPFDTSDDYGEYGMRNCVDTVRQMLDLNMPIEEIFQRTGVPYRAILEIIELVLYDEFGLGTAILYQVDVAS